MYFNILAVKNGPIETMHQRNHKGVTLVLRTRRFHVHVTVVRYKLLLESDIV